MFQSFVYSGYSMLVCTDRDCETVTTMLLEERVYCVPFFTFLFPQL